MAHRKKVIRTLHISFVKGDLSTEEKGFIELVTQDIQRLNQFIVTYNQHFSESNLDAIEAQIQSMTDRYPVRICQQFPHYLQAIYQVLMLEIYRERQKWCNKRIVYQDSNICLPQDSLTELIEMMSPSIMTQFLDLLYQDPFHIKEFTTKLALIYPPTHDEVSLHFHRFLQTHQFTLISDRFARIIKVTHCINGNACVIRCRKPNPKETLRVEKHARRVLSAKMPYFTHLFAEKAGVLSDGRLRVIQVVPFFQQRSCFHQLMHLHDEKWNEGKFFRMICTIHLQILDFFEQYQKANFFFTDGKLENFLCHQDEKTGEYFLQVIDLKSTRYLDGQGYYQTNQYLGDWDCTMIHTEGVTPTEVVNGQRCSAEKANVCMLGINLYTATTCRRLKYNEKRYKIKEPYDKNFSQRKLFKTFRGQQIQQLIMDSVKHNPEARLSYSEVKQRLNQIYPYDLEKQCRQQLHLLKTSAPFDDKIVHLTAKLNQLANTIDESGLKSFLQETQALYQDWQHKKQRWFQSRAVTSDEIQFAVIQRIKYLLTQLTKLGTQAIKPKIIDINLAVYIQQKRLEFKSASVEQLLAMQDELQSLLHQAKKYWHTIKNSLQCLPSHRQEDVLMAIRLLPISHRLTTMLDPDPKQFVQRMVIFKDCHELLKKISEYRMENINSHPIIFDIPIRQYLHLQIEALYQENLSLWRLKKIKNKIDQDLSRLETMIAEQTQSSLRSEAEANQRP